jgi:guanylate kinase
MEGKLVIFSAPSGSGKTTIVKRLLETGLNLEFSISATTRQPRPGETHGKDYYFLTVDGFKQKIKEGAFIEWEEVYPDQFYGTLISEMERIWESNKHVVFDIDVKGGINLKKQFKEKALSVFILPPSLEELAKRLRQRDSDNEEQIKKRLEKASYELTFASEFDITVTNNELEKAVTITSESVKTFLKYGNY